MVEPTNKIDKAKEKPKKPKKPYAYKKADLYLDEYKKELQDQSPTLLLQRARDALITSRQFHLYLVLQCVAAYFGFGQVMVCIGVLWMFYVNTGTRKEGEKSAYSVFNKNFEAIGGTTSMEDVDRELRRQMY